MPNIIPLVEGLGDIEAVPVLLYKILHDFQKWAWHGMWGGLIAPKA